MSALPPRPNLSQLKAQAKDLRKAVSRGDAEALALAESRHPDFDAASFSLQDAQLVVARQHQFASWPKLVAALKTDATPGRAQRGPVQVETWADAEARRLADFYNAQTREAPNCFAVTADEFQRGYDDRINPWPEEDNTDNKLAGHSQRRLLVATEGGDIAGFADIGRQEADEEAPTPFGLIRMLIYRPGADAAGRALLNAAEGYFRELRLGRSEAFTRHHYSFCQFGGAALSNTHTHIHSLLDARGYHNARFANDGLKMGWYTFARAIGEVAEPTPPDPAIALAVKYLPSRGERPHLEIKAFRGEELMAYTWSSSAESYCANPAARDTLYTDYVRVIKEEDQGQGWGRYLLERSLWEMQKEGYRQATLMCSLSNSRAHILYKNLGYKIVDSNCAFFKTL